MNIININNKFDWESISNKIVKDYSMILSLDNIMIGVRCTENKQNKRYTYVIQFYDEGKQDIEFISYLKNKENIEQYCTTNNFKKFLKIIKRIVNIYKKWNTLSVIR